LRAGSCCVPVARTGGYGGSSCAALAGRSRRLVDRHWRLAVVFVTVTTATRLGQPVGGRRLSLYYGAAPAARHGPCRHGMLCRPRGCGRRANVATAVVGVALRHPAAVPLVGMGRNFGLPDNYVAANTPRLSKARHQHTPDARAGVCAAPTWDHRRLCAAGARGAATAARGPRRPGGHLHAACGRCGGCAPRRRLSARAFRPRAAGASPRSPRLPRARAAGPRRSARHAAAPIPPPRASPVAAASPPPRARLPPLP